MYRSKAHRATPALLLVLCLLPLSGCKGKVRALFARLHHRRSTSKPNTTDYAGAIQTVLGTPQLKMLRWPDYANQQQEAQKFYNDRNGELAWTRGRKPTEATTSLIQLFADAQKKGLNPEDYDASRWAAALQHLETLRKSRDGSDQAQADIAQFDVAMTVDAIRYFCDLHLGRINPQSLNFDIDVPTKRTAFDIATLLNNQVVDSDDVASIAASVEPQNPMYVATEKALGHYMELAAQQSKEAPQPLPGLAGNGAKPVAVGGSYPALAELRTRLQLEGDLPGANAASSEGTDSAGAAATPQQTDGAPAAAGTAGVSDPPRNAGRHAGAGRYTPDLAAAVKKYQARHGLTADGKLYQSTIDSLNVPMTVRVQQLTDALERWRWLPQNYVQPRVFVNLPEFVVRTYGPDHSLAFKMLVVDGEADGIHDTPTFVRLMRYVVFRPYWNLPPDIVKKDLLRHVEKEGPGYLERNDYEVTRRDGKPVTGWTVADLEHARYLVRQKPGPKNSLGLVKFLLPNIYDVYLHSTPELNLFNLRLRDKSHGCVRLQHADQMALWVLSGDQPDPATQTAWDADKIDQAMNGDDNNKTVNLKTPLPVWIAYLTANADEDGTMHFFNDIYGYDGQLEAALAKGRPYEQAPVKINPKLTPGETE
jgi:murein L,D-transpeptidase YcbB/YkuD